MGARRAALVAAALLLPPLAAGAAAQCVLCGSAAGQAADAADGNSALAIGILVLLVPALTLLGGAGFLLWRFRAADGADSHRHR